MAVVIEEDLRRTGFGRRRPLLEDRVDDGPLGFERAEIDGFDSASGECGCRPSRCKSKDEARSAYDEAGLQLKLLSSLPLFRTKAPAWSGVKRNARTWAVQDSNLQRWD